MIQEFGDTCAVRGLETAEQDCELSRSGPEAGFLRPGHTLCQALLCQQPRRGREQTPVLLRGAASMSGRKRGRRPDQSTPLSTVAPDHPHRQGGVCPIVQHRGSPRSDVPAGQSSALTPCGHWGAGGPFPCPRSVPRRRGSGSLVLTWGISTLPLGAGEPARAPPSVFLPLLENRSAL